MTASLNVYGNAFEYDTDVDVYGVAFEWPDPDALADGQPTERWAVPFETSRWGMQYEATLWSNQHETVLWSGTGNESSR